MNVKSKGCAILATLLLLWLPTGCSSASHEEAASLAASMLYQPPVLRLAAGELVQTKDGQYRPQRDEVWHSDARYRTLEQQLIDAVAALRAKP